MTQNPTRLLVRPRPHFRHDLLLRTNLVILDGPRCSGKSTIGQALVEELQRRQIQAEYFKKGVPDPVDEASNMAIHLERWWDRVNDAVDVVVVDRFVATELVMALATGRTPPERAIPYCIETARRTMVAHHAINRVLLPPFKVLDERMQTRPEGRRWDIEPRRVIPLWTLALTMLPGVTVEQSTDQQVIIDKLIAQLIISE